MLTGPVNVSVLLVDKLLTAMMVESAHAAVRRLQVERDTLLREKSLWLSRISEDNSKLAGVLKVCSLIEL
jgi:hypothetical protein